MKRVISLLLVFVLTCCLMPIGVFANSRYVLENTRNVTGQDILVEARKWSSVGASYWSGTNPWEASIYWRTGYTFEGQTSFDCSGFVGRVLNDCGFRSVGYTPSYGSCILSQTYGSGYIGISIEELVNYGTDITSAVTKAKNGDYSELQPGDIIGWVSGSLGRHIIIYAGLNNGMPWMVEFTGKGYFDRAITPEYQSHFQYGARYTQATAGNAIQAESASFISRSDGVWLWPMPNYTMSDWAGCNGNSSCYFHPGDNHGGCAASSHATWNGYGHSGFDAAASVGTPVYAMADGTAYVRYQDARGYYIVIEHPIGKDGNGNAWSYYTYYQHLSEFTVTDGTPVIAGTTIGKTGKSGTSTGPHLHVGMVLGKSGCYDSIYDLECKGWVTTSGFQEGRILNNPALNSPAGNPTYTDGCESNVRMHAGSVMYTFNKEEVAIGFGDLTPVGAYDVATGGVNSVYVRGWAYDPDTPSESLEIHVYMDGVYIGKGVANTLREDVNAVYGCGNYHGFDITVPVTVAETGNHSIEVYALNTNTSGGNAYLGSKEVTITAHTHSYAESVTQAATCTQAGVKTYTCQGCADTYTEEIPATGHNYISKVVGATCTTVGHTAFTCDRCGDSYVEMSNGWSEWSTEYPTGVPENLIEEKIRYSTLEKEYTTSASDTLDGWTNIGTTYGDWGAVQTTTTKPAESDTLRITNTTQTGWGYYHWCNYYYNGGNNWNVDSIEYGGPCYWHGYTSEFELPAFSFPDQGGQQAYGGSGSGAVHCDYNFYVWFRNPNADVYTYSYQTRSKVNEFYKWSDEWTDWSDNAVESSEDIQVKTQTVYRYYVGELADHNYSYAVTKTPTTTATGVLTGTCTGCSGTTTETLPKLNTTDYKYSQVKAPSNTENGVGRYTWNTTAYGTFSFDVTLAKLANTGDLDGNGKVNEDDVIYLLQYLLMPEDFPVEQAVDYDKDNDVDEDDVIYLLQHLLMPEDFPLS